MSAVVWYMREKEEGVLLSEMSMKHLWSAMHYLRENPESNQYHLYEDLNLEILRRLILHNSGYIYAGE